MPRSLIVSCLLGAAALWPSAAAAQVTIGGCQLVFTEAGDSADKTRRELRGRPGVPVEITCGDVLLIADEVDQIVAEDRLIARGSVVFQQEGTRIAADHGEMNLKTRTGFFVNANGTLQLTDRKIDRSLFGTQEPEAIFSADRIEKTGARTYKLTGAVFSACVQPNRRWEVTASRLTFTVDKYAIMRGAVLKVKEVPVLYLPIFYYPIQEDNRATGFLMPSYGSSSYRGFTLSNAFFWAINRSHDATVYHDWFASSGQQFGADYRYVAGPNSRGDASVSTIREKEQLSADGTVTSAARQSFAVRGNISQSLPGRIRFQARADYFTDVTAQQLHQVDLAAFSRRSRYFGADASGNWGRLRFYAQAERSDVFYGTSAASNRYKPRASLSLSEAPILGTKLTLGGSLDTINAERLDDVDRPETRVAVKRHDGQMTLRFPLALGSALTLRSSVTVRRTEWNTSRDPVTGAFVETPLRRNIIETRAQIVGPVFTRVFNTPGNGFAERFKHVIEPSVTVKRTSAFDRFNEVVQFDHVDTVLGGDTQVTYGIVNRLMARVRQGDQPGVAREVMNLEVSQTYYSNSLAASYDQNYQSSFGNLYSYQPPPSKLSPVRGTINFTPTQDMGGNFSVEYDTQFRAVRSYRASVNRSGEVFDLNANWSKRQVIPGLAGFSNPLNADHFISFSTRARRLDGGASLGYTMTYDVLRERMLQQRIGAVYNAQCCGVSVDYSVTNLKHLGLRNDNRFSLSLTLAGIGSFANLLGAFGNNEIER